LVSNTGDSEIRPPPIDTGCDAAISAGIAKSKFRTGPGTGVLGGLDPELAHLLVEMAPLEPEARGGFGHVAAFDAQRLLDSILLESSHLLGEARVVVVGPSGL